MAVHLRPVDGPRGPDHDPCPASITDRGSAPTAELVESQLDKFHGTVSLRFAAGDNKKVAVKIVDDRGIESLKIISLEA